MAVIFFVFSTGSGFYVYVLDPFVLFRSSLVILDRQLITRFCSTYLNTPLGYFTGNRHVYITTLILSLKNCWLNHNCKSILTEFFFYFIVSTVHYVVPVMSHLVSPSKESSSENKQNNTSYSWNIITSKLNIPHIVFFVMHCY